MSKIGIGKRQIERYIKPHLTNFGSVDMMTKGNVPGGDEDLPDGHNEYCNNCLHS
jgi:hypothetical protein